MQDYLIVSSLPNVFNAASFSNGDRIINFGGTHSPGTLGVTTLIKNETVLGELSTKVMALAGRSKEMPYWQGLFLVDKIGEDRHPSRIQLVDVKKVRVNIPQLEKLVSKNMRALRLLQLR